MRTAILQWCRTGDVESVKEHYDARLCDDHLDLAEAILHNHSRVIKYLLKQKSFDFKDITTCMQFSILCKMFFVARGNEHPNRSLAAITFARSRRVPPLELQKVLFSLKVDYSNYRTTIEALLEPTVSLPISVPILKQCYSDYLLELVASNSTLEPTESIVAYVSGRLGYLPMGWRYHFRKYGSYSTRGNTPYHAKKCDFCRQRCTRSLSYLGFEMCMKCRG